MMTTDSIIYAGVELSSGRRPVTFAALDDDLNIDSVENWDITQALMCLKKYQSAWLAVTASSRAEEVYQEFRKGSMQAGFVPYSRKNDPKQLLITNAQDSFQALIGGKALPRRTLEGRLQRTAVLYEQGLQITDPMEIFEEITRYKLVQGILPLDSIYSSKELDALVAAYVAWLAVNRPGQIVSKGEFVLPAGE